MEQLEDHLVGLTEGESVTVTVPPEKAYGEPDEDGIVTLLVHAVRLVHSITVTDLATITNDAPDEIGQFEWGCSRRGLTTRRTRQNRSTPAPKR